MSYLAQLNSARRKLSTPVNAKVPFPLELLPIPSSQLWERISDEYDLSLLETAALQKSTVGSYFVGVTERFFSVFSENYYSILFQMITVPI